MDFFVQLKQYFDQLTLGQKVMTAVVFVFVSVAVGTLSVVLKQDSFTLLYGQLSPEDASHIVEQLKNEKIPYRLADSGKTIKVPSSQVYDLRLKLSTAGLPRGGQSGLELFDKGNVGMTDFTQQVNYQRAIQGELSRTISELESVQHARVHITFPDESSFLEEEKTASASVVLTLHPGAVLDQKQVLGIVNLVSGAVKGLKPEKVTLVDAFGTLLTRTGDDQSGYSTADNSLTLRRNIENYLEIKASSLLDRVLGPGKAVVKVTAVLNSQRVNEQTETYDPNGVVRSEQVSKDATGTSLKNYEVGKTVREIVGSVGNIEKLYVSVVVDGVVKPNEADPKASSVVPRSEEEIANYKQLVMQSVGFSEERGDQIDIKSIPFNHEYKDNVSKQMAEQEKTIQKSKTQERLMVLAGKALVSIAILLIVVLLLKTMKKSIVEQKEMLTATMAPQLAMATAGVSSLPEPRGMPPVEVPQKQTVPQLAEATQTAAPAVASAPAGTTAVPALEQKSSRVMEIDMEILKAAKENPGEVARAMQRAWIKK